MGFPLAQKVGWGGGGGGNKRRRIEAELFERR